MKTCDGASGRSRRKHGSWLDYLQIAIAFGKEFWMHRDAVILGSGFSGSLLAWILAASGRSVLVLDRQQHPRFAIGESSTPTADFLLAHLADRWNLPNLAPLACWGTWKQSYPNVLGGKKRGFSYYQHLPGKSFQEDPQHQHSLLVAASCEDHWSDTHWLRSSVDHFLAQQATAAGASIQERHEVIQCNWDPTCRRWQVNFQPLDNPSRQIHSIQTPWVIDASGAGAAMGPWVNNQRDDGWMRTRTRAIFGHFTGVADFHPSACNDDPFAGDDAAQHHLLDSGWIWMLRMESGITSVGLVEPCGNQSPQPNPEHHFQKRLADFPTIAELMSQASCIAPTTGMGQTSGRMSRCMSKAAGPGWFSLPLAYGFVDPLHSSGIAHALSGVVRVAEAITGDSKELPERIERYNRELRREVEWIDLLVACCYEVQPCFERFRAAASLYFVAAIAFEQQLARDPAHWPLGFLQSDDIRMKQVATEIYNSLQEEKKASDFNDLKRASDWSAFVADQIKPWDPVGLLDPKHRNRIAHSSAPKYAAIASRGGGKSQIVNRRNPAESPER
ncbi:MAG: NAD(P)/FAD-dependent oxidoreductase [Pirellulaceae bacterium]